VSDNKLVKCTQNVHRKLLAGRPGSRSNFFLWWNPSFGEMLDQVFSSCKRLC